HAVPPLLSLHASLRRSYRPHPPSCPPRRSSDLVEPLGGVVPFAQHRRRAHRDDLAPADGNRAVLDKPQLAERAAALRTIILRGEDRKSTRLNSSHVKISYAVFCLKIKPQTSKQV